jgi:hypothetical protein
MLRRKVCLTERIHLLMDQRAKLLGINDGG